MSRINANPAGDRNGVVLVWNPVGFDPRDCLPADLHRYADCARYFVHRIHYETVFDRRLRGEFVPLKAEYLRTMFPKNGIYKRVRDSLIERGAILCDNHYVAREKSCGYKLGPELAARRQHRTTLTDRTLCRKLRKKREGRNKEDEVHRHLRYYLERIEIDYSAALASLLAEPDFEPADETAIQLIRDRQFFLHVCDYGRVHTNLTNLKSSLRPFLSYKSV